jgi:hypothetical protein
MIYMQGLRTLKYDLSSLMASLKRGEIGYHVGTPQTQIYQYLSRCRVSNRVSHEIEN